MKFDFFQQIFEKYSKTKFMKIRPVGAEVVHADRRKDGQADVTKLIVSSKPSVGQGQYPP